MPTPYKPMKPRIFDAFHMEEYIEEIDDWLNSQGKSKQAKALFPELRALILRQHKKLPDPIPPDDKVSLRARKKNVEREMRLVRDYVRAMDKDERRQEIEREKEIKRTPRTSQAMFEEILERLDRIEMMVSKKKK